MFPHAQFLPEVLNRSSAAVFMTSVFDVSFDILSFSRIIPHAGGGNCCTDRVFIELADNSARRRGARKVLTMKPDFTLRAYLTIKITSIAR